MVSVKSGYSSAYEWCTCCTVTAQQLNSSESICANATTLLPYKDNLSFIVLMFCFGGRFLCSDVLIIRSEQSMHTKHVAKTDLLYRLHETLGNVHLSWFMAQQRLQELEVHSAAFTVLAFSLVPFAQCQSALAWSFWQPQCNSHCQDLPSCTFWNVFGPPSSHSQCCN